MRHIMKHAVIVSGGNINTDFALDFLKKNTDENTLLIAADRGLEFFERTGLVPDIAVGDFDSLSESGKKFLETLSNTEIIRLRPEKDDSDTQSAACLAMDRGMKRIMILGATGNRVDHLMANFGLLVLAAGNVNGSYLAAIIRPILAAADVGLVTEDDFSSGDSDTGADQEDTCMWPQFINIIRIRKKPHVKNKICIIRYSIFETKRKN